MVVNPEVANLGAGVLAPKVAALSLTAKARVDHAAAADVRRNDEMYACWTQ